MKKNLKIQNPKLMPDYSASKLTKYQKRIMLVFALIILSLIILGTIQNRNKEDRKNNIESLKE